MSEEEEEEEEHLLTTLGWTGSDWNRETHTSCLIAGRCVAVTCIASRNQFGAGAVHLRLAVAFTAREVGEGRKEGSHR